MKRIFFLTMIASLLASMLLINAGMADYVPGAEAMFMITLPNGSISMNPSDYGGHPDVCENFNITVWIGGVTELFAFGVTILWNSCLVEATGGIWEGDVFADVPDAVKTDLLIERIQENITILTTPTSYGIMEGAGQNLKDKAYNKTGDFTLFTMEFHVLSYDVWWYIWKTSGTREDLYPDQTLTESGWMNSSLPPYIIQDYDVVWVSGYEGVANALLIVNPPPPVVGGTWIFVDKFVLLAPYIGLASTILVATAATAIYVKRRKKKQ